MLGGIRRILRGEAAPERGAVIPHSRRDNTSTVVPRSILLRGCPIPNDGTDRGIVRRGVCAMVKVWLRPTPTGGFGGFILHPVSRSCLSETGSPILDL
jgi:hypothetical protein